MAIRGILLDVDGTLVLSNDAQAQAWVKSFTARGHDVPLETVRPLIGLGGDKVVPTVAPGLNNKDGDGALQPAPGSRELVQRAARGDRDRRG